MVDIFSPNFEFEMPNSLYLKLLERHWFEDLDKKAIGVVRQGNRDTCSNRWLIISWDKHDEFVEYCKRTWHFACRIPR